MVIPQVINGNFSNKRPIRRFFCRILWVDAEVVANAIDIRVRPHGSSELETENCWNCWNCYMLIKYVVDVDSP